MTSTAQPSRRGLFALGSVAVASAALPAALPVFAEDDGPRFLAWERERDGYWANAEHRNATEEATDYWSDRAAAVETLIHATPGRSREAVLVKARLLRGHRSHDLDPRGVEAVDQIIAFLTGAH